MCGCVHEKNVFYAVLLCSPDRSSHILFAAFLYEVFFVGSGFNLVGNCGGFCFVLFFKVP